VKKKYFFAEYSLTPNNVFRFSSLPHIQYIKPSAQICMWDYQEHTFLKKFVNKARLKSLIKAKTVPKKKIITVSNLIDGFGLIAADIEVF
jgi:hypothetical protein